MITKEIEHQIEITADNHIQVRKTTIIVEDGKELTRQHHRYVISPGDDYSMEPERVKKVCELVHSERVVKAYKDNQVSEDSLITGD